MINLRSYDLAVSLYRDCRGLRLSTGLKDQITRASSSVVLNLAEGWGKRTQKDRNRYFVNALGSVREIQAIFDLEPETCEALVPKVDHLAACIYKLSR